MIPVFAVSTAVSLSGPPGKKRFWMLTQSLLAGSMEIFPQVLETRVSVRGGWYRIVTRYKGEVEEEEEKRRRGAGGSSSCGILEKRERKRRRRGGGKGWRGKTGEDV